MKRSGKKSSSRRRRNTEPSSSLLLDAVGLHQEGRLFSPDFRRHAMRFFIEPVLEHHDRRRFHVYCYYNAAVADEATRCLS